jgi:hypothetical protein
VASTAQKTKAAGQERHECLVCHGKESRDWRAVLYGDYEALVLVPARWGSDAARAMNLELEGMVCSGDCARSMVVPEKGAQAVA